MSSRFDLIAQAILKKPFADCSLSELEALAQTYPSFAPAHFLRAKKLQQSGISNPEAAVQKAAFYYHQPPFFEAFLHNDEVIFSRPDKEEEIITSIEPEEPEENELAPAEEAIIEAPPAEAKTIDEPVADAVSNTEEIAEQVPDATSPSIASDNVNATASSLNEAPQPQPEPLAFEPFHTVDYFASQGIKLSQDSVPKDKFGKQLKSFTEWLKTMKKLPVSEQAKTIDPQAEQKVENLAAHSVEGADVVTETMAEVWVKQGNKQKAAEVYHKLSLLHPSKSAYFAAKIENLK